MSDTKIKTVTVIGEMTTLGGTYWVLSRQRLDESFEQSVAGFLAVPIPADGDFRMYYETPSLVIVTTFAMRYYPKHKEIDVIDLDPTLPENEFAVDMPELTEAEWQHIFENGELNEDAQE